MKRQILKYLLVLALLTVGCRPKNALEPGQICTDEMKALLINTGPNTVTERMETYHPIDHHGAIHHCGSRSTNGGPFYQEVYKYSSVEQAVREYDRQLTVFFYQNEFIGSWEDLVPSVYPGLSADEYSIACARRDTGTQLCKFMAQYDDFIVYLTANMSLTPMSLEDFVTAVENVDSQFLSSTQFVKTSV